MFTRQGASKGYAFVEFEEHRDALAALRRLNNCPKVLFDQCFDQCLTSFYHCLRLNNCSKVLFDQYLTSVSIVF